MSPTRWIKNLTYRVCMLSDNVPERNLDMISFKAVRTSPVGFFGIDSYVSPASIFA